jgi:PTH1 family peptidyl-tRNA hydrolase
MLATQNYPRLRFGIGDGFMKGQQVDFVLSSWTEEETKELNERLEMAKNMVHSFCIIGVDRTMSEYNNK